jgi:hypothetical protein
MSKAVISPPESTTNGEVHRPGAEEIRAQLAAILASPAFHGSKRCQKFLEHVCGKALAGQESTLKERTVAIEVFGRPPESDLGEDTIVRVGAREVRKRLAQFYVSPEGAVAEVRIDLPPGTYVPEFRYAVIRREPEPAAPAAPVVIVKPPRPAWWRQRTTLAGVAVALTVALGTAYLKWTAASPNVEAFRLFWQPALRAAEPLLVAVAHPIVYHASRRALRLNNEVLGPTTEGQRTLQLPPKMLDGSDMVPVLNQYVGFGDMVMATEITSLLARNQHATRVRFASAVEFADMRSGPTLLIGATTNRWTMEFQAKWRFQFVRNADQRVVIADRQTGKDWSIPAKDDGSSPDDYILVCRIRNSVTGGLVLLGAGLKQFGTEAAGHLLTDPDQLGVILRKLPRGWESRNLQVVLHSQVIGNTPAQPEVVASHVW